jgi:carboxypeptidase C (cathepsin A)
MAVPPRSCRASSVLTIASLLTFTSIGFAQDKPEEKPATPPAAATPHTTPSPITPDSTTDGSVNIGGQTVNYRAVAGTITVGGTDPQDATLGFDGRPLPDANVHLPERAEDAPPIARMFYVAYFKKDVPAASRPIIFAYNGGPGSPTMWLHMGTFGPKRIVTPDTQHQEGAPYNIVNNDFSILDVADIVFIDAPGTGLSRTFGKNKAEAF